MLCNHPVGQFVSQTKFCSFGFPELSCNYVTVYLKCCVQHQRRFSCMFACNFGRKVEVFINEQRKRFDHFISLQTSFPVPAEVLWCMFISSQTGKAWDWHGAKRWKTSEGFSLIRTGAASATFDHCCRSEIDRSLSQGKIYPGHNQSGFPPSS